MQFAPNSPRQSAATTALLTPSEWRALVDQKEHEIVDLRRQVAWFQRQIFGQKSERRQPEPDGVQASLGESFAVVPDETPPNKKSRIVEHTRYLASRLQPTVDEQ